MEEKNKKKGKLWIIALLVTSAVLILACSILFKKQEDNFNSESIAEKQIDLIDKQGDYSLINMNNVENVEIKDGIKENNSEALLKDKTFEGMRVTEIRLVAENGMTNFTAKVENNSRNDFQERNIIIVFKNQDGTEYARLNGFLPDIKVGESSIIDSSTTADLSNAYDFIIE